MGLFSALSGKIYHFNSINTPIDNELAKKIKDLDDSIGKIALLVSFGVAQETISEIFHPDNGILRNYIKNLEKSGFRIIWNSIMTYVIWNILEEKNENEKNDIIKKTMLVLEMDKHKLDLHFIIYKNKSQIEQLCILWQIICNQIQPGLDNDNNTFEFSNIFIDVYNKIIFK